MIALNNISKSFGQLKVLKDISVTFYPGKTTAIIGPSGSGKSTLLRCINLLEKPEAGTLAIGDIKVDFSKAVKGHDLLAVRRSSGMVFQGFHLFPHLTIQKNIIEGPVHVLGQSKQEAAEYADALLKKVGLSDKADHYPEQLSGGQQQRAAIARALAMKPQFLLFDEPTSALDPELEAEVLKVLRSLAREGNSMLIVTHNLNFAREVADEIIFLEQGQFLYRGSAKDAFNGGGCERLKEFISAMFPPFVYEI